MAISRSSSCCMAASNGEGAACGDCTACGASSDIRPGDLVFAIAKEPAKSNDIESKTADVDLKRVAPSARVIRATNSIHARPDKSEDCSLALALSWMHFLRRKSFTRGAPKHSDAQSKLSQPAANNGKRPTWSPASR